MIRLFNNRYQTISIVLGLMFVLFISAPVQAVDVNDAKFIVTNVTLDFCSTTGYEVRFDLEFDIADAPYAIYFGTTDPAGDEFMFKSSLNFNTSPINWSFIGGVFAAQTYPYTTSFYYTFYDDNDYASDPTFDPALGVNTKVFELTCTGPNTGVAGIRQAPVSAPVAPLVSPDPQPVFTDGRINDFDAAAPISIYPIMIDGQTGLHIYGTDNNLLLIITPQMIADAPENPSENIIIATNNGVIFSRIVGENGGLWQINAPQYNGKTYILIFPEFYANGGYTSYEE